MKKFLQLMAAGSLTVAFATSALAQTASSSSSAMSSSMSSTSSQWEFTGARIGGTKCEELTGPAKRRCSSGALKDAAQRIKAILNNAPIPVRHDTLARYKVMETKMIKMDARMKNVTEKFRQRTIKEMERVRQQKFRMMHSSSSASSM
ncbi:hypothetical protein EXS70_04510 [Candidatus Peribacteria bacterium]|nr:hypothetical protein [Candidatus Peribacteria bacterium]